MKHRETGYTFAQVPRADIPRSVFNRSHGHKTTIYAGALCPLYVDEVIPGDTFNVRASVFARMATPLVPIMDNLYIDLFWFFVPNRLVWNNWQKFCGEQDNPGDSVDFLIPQVTIDIPSAAPPPNMPEAQALFSLMGVPCYTTGLYTVNNLFARGYNLIWNEWFRDQNLQTRAVVDKDDGPDTFLDYYIRPRGKRHDYFTSALPWPQKGPGVDIPISGIPVVGANGGFPVFNLLGDNAFTSDLHVPGAASGVDQNVQVDFSNATPSPAGNLRWFNTGLEIGVPAGEATGTINALRQAFQLQKLLERDARGGTRYTELVRSHFGVVSPDARLQRPEYLGGHTIPVNIKQVEQSSASGAYASTPQGHLAAYGVAMSSGSGFTKSFTEHGMVFCLAAIRADLTYQQGLSRMWSRRTKYDFYWPALAHIGEQAILNKEIYLQADSLAAENDAVFGYQERWAEYRYNPSKVTGFMNSMSPLPLDIWHLAEKFEDVPTLSAAFIEQVPPIDRVVAVSSDPAFLVDAWFNIKAARPMPVYSVPGLVDHF